MANPHQLLPGNTAFGRLSAASSPLPTHSSTPAVDYPQAFTAEQLASLAAENDILKEELHDLSSQIANLPLPQTPPPPQDLSVLQ